MGDFEFERAEGEGGWNGGPERKKVALMRKIVEKEDPESKVDLFLDVFVYSGKSSRRRILSPTFM